ncbi:MAG: hypothetical protein A2268_10575 [Candidatus Raymondbacteria bacterium RifOxyA12_full_50_37]|uniref:Cytokinin riboside 5'-monophosphate phosphoribohydrolase n=1 Tax=Candidatus Raymondbacteria bacterium RIFOXYD12_FULL_49_13 TaxID=1817890 RepID=A0A1F7F8P1_UNCRA|nr:MAG: hypothetical protein A2268_10575 [Candidatus Raymondbacteria bacterium RifOxyA12_full_50_37]OGJ85409.1 MAG: hypothetical protein A2248_12360 [Candidatus Raymondbacteria bacterium RIFOXYA2_FULL_49_16]OGJ86133.1 MAG: hypothetical protein A2350_18820 [Candidatus Raymondbacteria bacterium RifOxyB12_full_50_8]OGJ94917.1 MAG: hypothetical protein A2453_07830 [Candidatus Raymondbacteria bacterium RIFOXYC2_FULL_50_21]OGJ98675.1 MAG: hypothetical protein A2487_05680 [Candidatus Raymondbacteria b
MKKIKPPVKAYDNQEFLHGHAGRMLRILSEFMEPAERFKDHFVNNTIVFFGSARSLPRAQYSKKKLLPGEKREKGMVIAEANEKCVLLAKKIAQWSNRIEDPAKRFAICTGGGPGMMGAANRGATLGKGKSIGLNISLPFEQHPNPNVTPGLSFEFHYFFIRKFWFLYFAKALIAFPGGFGTFDEIFELLTLIQTRKLNKRVPIVLFGKTFWEEIFNFKALVHYGVISKEDLDLFLVTDSVDEAFAYVTTRISKHYL